MCTKWSAVLKKNKQTIYDLKQEWAATTKPHGPYQWSLKSTEFNNAAK
jgi:hypothetical protein